MPDITSFHGIGAAPRTASALHALIEQIDLAVFNLLRAEDKDAGASYRVGDRELKRDGYLRWLLEARRDYLAQLAALPAWATTQYDDPDL